MDSNARDRPVPAATSETHSRSRVARSGLLALAAVWFLLQALLPVTFIDPGAAVIELVQRLALGFALVALALVDWQTFRGLFGIE
jgi:hypothetical protein